PSRVCERNRNARLAVVEVRLDVVVKALKAIDVAPGGLPAAEIVLQFLDRCRERSQSLLRGRLPPELLAPENGERGGDGACRPAAIPIAKDVDRFGQLRLQRIGGRQLVVVFQQRWQQLVERGKIAVERGVDQLLQREVLLIC